MCIYGENWAVAVAGVPLDAVKYLSRLHMTPKINRETHSLPRGSPWIAEWERAPKTKYTDIMCVSLGPDEEGGGCRGWGGARGQNDEKRVTWIFANNSTANHAGTVPLVPNESPSKTTSNNTAPTCATHDVTV